jgi:hypothetical protein
MVRLAGNPDEGQHLGQEGRRRVELRFDVRNMVAQYESLYALGSDGAAVRPTRDAAVLSAP